MTYKMNLKLKPFEAILNKTKTIEMRLYDEKRQQLKIGDYIEFNCKDSNKTIKAKIKSLFICSNFDRLYELFPKTKLGYSENETACPCDMLNFYPQEEMDKFGVVGIEIEVIEIV